MVLIPLYAGSFHLLEKTKVMVFSVAVSCFDFLPLGMTYVVLLIYSFKNHSSTVLVIIRVENCFSHTLTVINNLFTILIQCRIPRKSAGSLTTLV